uniref:Uncharacterized protein n=1 Tax=Rhizophora mucronata TaxID=61149 RepID=A0A2P2R3I9_RHIMU
MCFPIPNSHYISVCGWQRFSVHTIFSWHLK